MVTSIRVGDRLIAHDAPVFIIAEAGVNHNGSLERARELVRTAARAGADAIKFQTFRSDDLVAADAPKAGYQRQRTRSDETQRDMLRALELSVESHVNLMQCAREEGILFLSSPFDERSAAMLAQLGVPAFKIGSGEITNIPFLESVARYGCPVLLSTGMAWLDEVGRAVRAMADQELSELVLLHCVSCYPADVELSNLRAIDTLRRAFGLPVGFSDHSLGTEVAIAAVALGAAVIEKHITTDARLPGPDHAASMEPDVFRRFVKSLRIAEAALGDGIKRPFPAEIENAHVARKSLFSARFLPAGHIMSPGDMIALRPASGLPPDLARYLVGRRLRTDVPARVPLELGMLD